MLFAANRQSTQQGLWLVGIGLLVSAAFIVYFSVLFARRIGTLISASAAISDGHYDQHAPQEGVDEIAQLARHFNLMAESISQRIAALEESRAEIARLNAGLELRVLERTQELADANTALEETIQQLKQTQESLVHSVKLASLGELVAGVAHELDTPLGNALTVAFSLVDRTREFLTEMQAGLKRSSLKKYIEMVQSSTPLITRNLERAAEPILSFKPVAVDRASSKRRRFDLTQVIREISNRLRPSFKKTPYKLDLSPPDGISMDSFPGPFGQVLTNLVNNALNHGFDGRAHGRMLIEAVQEGANWIQLTFSDDDNGIPPEHLKRIFDPFFTTRLGQGGSGLGLRITFNIIQGVLGGQIQVQPTYGEGTRFIIDLPLEAPALQGSTEKTIA